MCFAGRLGLVMATTSASRGAEKSGVRLWFKRLGWLVLIWSASVLALGGIALLMRLFMHLIGLG